MGSLSKSVCSPSGAPIPLGDGSISEHQNKSSAESSDGQRDWGQVLGLVYLGLGVLIFVAL